MNQEEINKQIFERLEKLEKTVFSDTAKKSLVEQSQKPRTLPELIRGKNISSPSKKVAIIVGYKEKIIVAGHSSKQDIRQGWIDGKFTGMFRTNLIELAVKSGLVRKVGNNTYDLSQSGEQFFADFLGQNA